MLNETKSDPLKIFIRPIEVHYDILHKEPSITSLGMLNFRVVMQTTSQRNSFHLYNQSMLSMFNTPVPAVRSCCTKSTIDYTQTPTWLEWRIVRDPLNESPLDLFS